MSIGATWASGSWVDDSWVSETWGQVIPVVSAVTPVRGHGSPMTIGALHSELLGWLDESNALTTSSTYLNASAALKQAHTLRVTEDQWKFMLWPGEASFTTTLNRQVYSLHQEFMRPYYMRNYSRKQWMVETPSRNLTDDSIDMDLDQGNSRYTIWGRSAVANQPTSASVVTIVSSSDSDVSSSQAIVITGDTENDGVASETIVPIGTIPTAGSIEFTNILDITKSTTWTGTMTVTANDGDVHVLTLFANEYGRSYPQIQLLYQPCEGEVIKYKFYRKPKDFINPGDITNIPAPFERILIFDALLMMGSYDKRLDGGRMALWQKWRDDLDFQMRQTYIEGQSLGAEPRLIGMGGGYGSPRIRGNFD